MIIDAPEGSQMPALRRLWQEAFADTDAFLDAFEKTAFSAERCRCVTVGDEVAAALYWFDCQFQGKQIAYLYAVATAEAYRGRGFCHALLENTHQHLYRLGYEGAILVPGSPGLFGLYGGMGYRVCSTVGQIMCEASDEEVPLQPVSVAEYAALRRELLPAGGVLQENENLQFLQTQVRLFAGSGFLLAARVESGKLCGVELLGDLAKAPGIVRAFGCKRGMFRCPGEGSPFAMYRKLAPESTLGAPSYFGLAFD